MKYCLLNIIFLELGLMQSENTAHTRPPLLLITVASLEIPKTTVQFKHSLKGFTEPKAAIFMVTIYYS